MKDMRIEKLANNIIAYSCNIKPGEKVIIESFGDYNYDFIKALIRGIYALGATPFLWANKMDVHRELLMSCNEEQLALMAKSHRIIMEEMDVYIRVRGEENTSELNDVPSKNMANYASIYRKPVHSNRKGSFKWCVMHYPTHGMAQAEGMSMDYLEDYFFDVCAMDYSIMKKAFEPLKLLMDKTDKVRITGKGTDVTFSIKGIPATPCAGGNNIPDGEIFSAPIKGSIKGKITYNTTAFYDGVTFENVSFEFEDGKIAKATSNDDKRLNEILDRDEGSRYIGEFAIGVNPYITKPMKDSMFNEKMTGSIHFTPGNSIESSDNGNRSAIHWDLVLAQTPEYGGGEIYFDDVLIRKDGRFVLKELEGLNPENLK